MVELEENKRACQGPSSRVQSGFSRGFLHWTGCCACWLYASSAPTLFLIVRVETERVWRSSFPFHGYSLIIEYMYQQHQGGHPIDVTPRDQTARSSTGRDSLHPHGRLIQYPAADPFPSVKGCRFDPFLSRSIVFWWLPSPKRRYHQSGPINKKKSTSFLLSHSSWPAGPSDLFSWTIFTLLLKSYTYIETDHSSWNTSG